MITNHEWAHWALLILGFGGLGICVSWAARYLMEQARKGDDD